MIGNGSPIAASRGCARWLEALTATLTVFHIGEAARSANMAPELAARVSLSMPLEFVASSIWALLSAFVTYTLVRRRPRALQYTALLLIGFVGYSLVRLLVFVRADYDQQRLPFLLVVGIIVFIIPSSFVLRLARVATQPTENSGNDRKPED